MPRLSVPKHPEFSRRNKLLVACVSLHGYDKAMATFNLKLRRVYQIMEEYERGTGRSYKWITKAEERKIVHLYKKHKSMRKVARLVGRDHKTIKRLFKRMAIPTYKSGWKGHD